MNNSTPDDHKCWVKVVVLFDYIDKLKKQFPEPRAPAIDNLITRFEQRLAIEVQELKKSDAHLNK